MTARIRLRSRASPAAAEMIAGFRGSARKSLAYRSRLGVRFHLREIVDERRDDPFLLLNQPFDGLLDPEDRANAPARLPGDDERRSAIVHQGMVGLIHNGDLKAALHHIDPRVAQVVAQVVESELPQRSIHDVASIGDPAFGVAHVAQYRSDRQAQELVGRGKQLSVPQGKIVVRG